MPFIKTNKLQLESTDSFNPNAHNFYQTVEYLNYLVRTKQGNLIELSLDKNSLCYALVKTKLSFFGFDLLWCPGGIIKTATFETTIQKKHAGRLSILIVGTFQTNNDRESTRIIGANKTILINVADFRAKLRMSKNWRKNQRRAYQVETVCRSALLADLEQIMYHIQTLEEFKKINLGIDTEFVKSVLLCPDCTCLIAEDKNKNFLGFRAAFLGRNTAFDLVAVNSLEGKRRYASYLLVTEIINLAHSRGIEYFDFGGIDEKNNLAVYNFKKGIGGEETFYESEVVQNVYPFITKLLKKMLRK